MSLIHCSPECHVEDFFGVRRQTQLVLHYCILERVVEEMPAGIDFFLYGHLAGCHG